MNDTNNTLDNNNVTPMPQSNTPNGDGKSPEINNSDNNTFETNSISSMQQEQLTQQNQNNNITETQNTLDTNLNNQMPSNNPNVIQQNQNFGSNQVDDEELLKSFIGKNYEKITTKKFNFAAFFFNSTYMCYRKMFGYGILLAFLLYFVIYIPTNLINSNLVFIPTLAVWIVCGFFTNKLYLSYAKKKIALIKSDNPQKSIEELKTICATKGGTSVGKVFLNLLIELIFCIICFIILIYIGIGNFIVKFLNIDNWFITTNERDNKDIDSKDKKILENAIFSGYGCFGSKCNVSIDDSNGNSIDYELSIPNTDLFTELGDYEDYIKVDIYYVENKKTNTIVDYKIFLKSNNEDISNVKNVGELRDKIGLYSLGTHTDTLTLIEIGITGYGYNDNNSYTYTSYTLADSHNNEYEMKYINDNGTSNLVEGNKYNVTFEVTEGTFDYEYIINSIQ